MNAVSQWQLQKTMNVLAIDDEPLALARLEHILRDFTCTRLVASTSDPDEAPDLVARLRPDIILLDIEMPGTDGLELARQLTRQGGQRPLVIFVTASEQHAISAFEAQATDYVLKPVTPSRLKAAIRRASALIEQERSSYRLRELEQRLMDAPAAGAVSHDTRDAAVIWALRGNQFVPLRTGEIEWAESERDYVHIYNNERAYLLRTTLSALHERLGHDRYVRVRRSVIVRLDRISAIRDRGYGDIQVLLQSGQVIQVGRTYLKSLRQRLKGGNDSEGGARPVQSGGAISA